MLIRIIPFLLAAAVAAPRPCAAQDLSERNREIARPLINDATRAYEARDLAKAERLLLAAYRIYPSDKIQYSLGSVYEARREWVAAMQAYDRYLALPQADRDEQRTAEVVASMARIARHVGRLVLVGDSGSLFQIDEAEQRVLPSRPLWLAPGMHRLRSPGQDQQIELKAGQTETVQIATPPQTAGGLRAVFPGAVPKEPAPAPSVRPEAAAGPPRPAPAVSAAPERRPARARWKLGVGLPLAAVGLFAAGVGIAGIAADGICVDDSRPCDARYSSRAQGAGMLAGGLLLLGAGAALVTLDILPERRAGRRVSLAPQAGQGAAGLVLAGVF